jgi:hypothetical protein
MTQQEIKEMAKRVVGDGGTPNKWFVTTGPYYRSNVSNPDWEFELMDGYSEKDVYTYGPFDTYEDAVDCYEAETLYADSGVCQAFIEDRKCGTVREKWLTKKVVVEYEEDEVDHSKIFY